MKKLITLSLFACTLFMYPSCKNANSNGEENATKTADKANDRNLDSTNIKDDAEFAVKAASGSMMEVELGNMAATNGASQLVKDFGRQMVADHSQANQELKSVAASKNITLPAAPGDDKQKMIEDLRTKRGTDFDKAYIDMMVSDHKDDIDEFQKEADKGNDPDIKQWASSKVPTLQHHHQMAQDIQDQLKRSRK